MCKYTCKTDKTQHSKQRVVHAPDGIRTYNLSSRAAADLRLRPRGHWDRQINKYQYKIEINRYMGEDLQTAFQKIIFLK